MAKAFEMEKLHSEWLLWSCSLTFLFLCFDFCHDSKRDIAACSLLDVNLMSLKSLNLHSSEKILYDLKYWKALNTIY